MKKEDFEKLVLDAFYAIPERFRDDIDNVALTVEDDVSEEDRKEEGLEENETLLGLYVGVPNSERGSLYGVDETLPDVIKIYQKNNEAHALETGRPVKEIVKETVWHEYAHYFGMDESEVRKWEDERASNDKEED